MRPLSLVSNHTRFAATARIYVHFGPFNIAPWVADVDCWEVSKGLFPCPVPSSFLYLAAVPFCPLRQCAFTISSAVRSGWWICYSYVDRVTRRGRHNLCCYEVHLIPLVQPLARTPVGRPCKPFSHRRAWSVYSGGGQFNSQCTLHRTSTAGSV